ncbi:MAG: CDP-2,3-bis-(O-geranylgeranyl)-sn-glycerol synthase [Candidatus Nezhaarchaeota archaeon]|nr:CDP-2,3-bis-(O-geranylgeranyl)-sn-glycerol synthase [Candidatus Nezhaarchaeota archaeon]MCX8141748.1 CDP-2,3-bis-(O-geranylgeranyl)-sn-glycerol synthase [Candidatus Nezhaarchaeota archaeon]MDW8050474.1 CDP-2,3-bis-(O-geranylgeranyl)-sn-glycerol synthase [Nitrososphaerota archaeon]
MDLLHAIELTISAIFFVLPAYIANATPLVLAKFIPKRRPMDLGKYWIDGKRILGDNKSIEGFIAGVFAGLVTGFLLHTPLKGFLMGLGAMVGDALGSFIKRRLNIKQGESAPILDQFSFILVALLFSSSAGYIPRVEQLIIILIATPILHVSSNYVAYLLKMKSRPL